MDRNDNERAALPGDRVRVASGDYAGRIGTYEGREGVMDAHLVHLDGDALGDPAVQCDRVEAIAPALPGEESS